MNLQGLPSPFQKLGRFISPKHPERVSLSLFLIAIPRKLAPSGFSTCPQYGFSLSLPQVVISSRNSCGVALPAALLHVQTAVKRSLQGSRSMSTVPWHHRGRVLVRSSLQLSAHRAACGQVAGSVTSLMRA